MTPASAAVGEAHAALRREPQINAGSAPAPSVPSPSRRIVALDGLRGITALMVLFHHTLLMLPDFANAEWGIRGAQVHGVFEWLLIRTPLRLMWSGEARALLFFVLSGFVLALPWLNGRTAPYSRFLLGRFCRIYPPYLIAMIIAATGSILLGGREITHATIFFNQLGWAFRPSWAALPSIIAGLDNRSSEYMNEGMWTLVWEIRIAFVFPLLMLPILRWGNRGIIGLLMLLVGLHHAAAWLIGASAAVASSAPQQMFYYAQFFVFGAAVAANRARLAAVFNRSGPRLAPACLALGGLVCWVPWPVEDDRMIGLGASIILAAIVGDGEIQSWFVRRPLLWLGERSYSLYLTHLPLIMAVIIAFQGKVSIGVCAAVIPAALVVSWAFHRWVELPSVAMAQHLTAYSRAPRVARTPSILPAALLPAALVPGLARPIETSAAWPVDGAPRIDLSQS